MLSKKALIDFILKNSADHKEAHLESLNIQSLVIIKVDIEVDMLNKRRRAILLKQKREIDR